MSSDFDIPEGLKKGNSIPILNELAWKSLDEKTKVQLSNQVISSPSLNSHVSIGEVYVLMVLKNSISDVVNHIVIFHAIEKNFDSLKRLILSRFCTCKIPSSLKMTIYYIWSPTYSLISHHLHYQIKNKKIKKYITWNLFSRERQLEESNLTQDDY